MWLFTERNDELKAVRGRDGDRDGDGNGDDRAHTMVALKLDQTMPQLQDWDTDFDTFFRRFTCQLANNNYGKSRGNLFTPHLLHL